MRYFEISSGLRLPVSAEEREMIVRCHDQPISETDMDEREAYIAHEMTVRGLLRRIDSEDGARYETDKMDLWRF